MSQRGAWNAWLVFFLQGIAAQPRDAVARTQRLHDLHESYRTQLQAGRAAARLLQLVDLLFAHPILTIRHAEAELKCGFATAQRYVEQLAQAGILEEITGKSRNRVFRASRVIAAIDEPIDVPGTGPGRGSKRAGEELPRYTIWR